MELSLFWQIILFSFVGGILSLVGGAFLLWKSELAQRISLHLVTFAAGTLLAVVFLDLLPEALELGGEPTQIFPWTLGGIIGFFALEAMLVRFNLHREDEVSHAVTGHTHVEPAPQPYSRHSLPWLVTIGDGIHNFVDGVAITAAFLVSVPTGIVTALAIAAHEVPQEISDFSILLHGGLSKRRVAWLNIGAALMTTVGAVLAYLLRETIDPFLPIILAVTAGIFIYIAAANLIPEIQHHHRHRDKPSHVIVILILAALLTSALTTWAHQYLEAGEHAETEESIILEEEQPAN